MLLFFFFNDAAPAEIYTLPLPDALPIFAPADVDAGGVTQDRRDRHGPGVVKRRRLPDLLDVGGRVVVHVVQDRKSTRLNSSHANISYAVFSLKKKNSLPHHRTHTLLNST